MITTIVGIALLAWIIYQMRSETADPLWFSSFMGFFEVTRTRRPIIYWLAVSSEILFALAVIAWGLISL